MKLKITEEQLRLIIESEQEDKGENLMDLTNAYEGGLSPDKWDGLFKHINKKKGGKYAGYYINGEVDLSKSDVTEFKYLVKVGGHLSLDNTKIESLPMLSTVKGFLSLNNTKIKELPMLSTVKNILYLANTEIKSLPEGLEVGMSLILKNTPLSKTTTEEELRNKIKVKDKIIL